MSKSTTGAAAPTFTSDHKRNLLDAGDLLSEARCTADFVQSLALNAGEVSLAGGQVTGFYFVMQDLMDRIQKAETLLTEYIASERGASHD